jgi:hypothetical protein
MNKVMLFLIALMMVMLVAGCQQAGLTEEEVRSIVREEITNQLVTGQLKGIVGQEITKELSNISELTLSRLIIKSKDGKHFTYLDDKGLIISRDGKIVCYLTCTDDGNGTLGLKNSGDKRVVLLGGLDSEQGGGFLQLSNRYGERIFSVGSLTDSGALLIYDRYGDVKFAAPGAP